MIITVLKDNRQIPNMANSLSDISLESLKCSLDKYIGASSDIVQIPIIDEVLNREIFPGLKYYDVIDEETLNGGDEIANVFFKVEKIGNNSFSLLSNGNKVVEFELPPQGPENISNDDFFNAFAGNLLNADYEIHGYFYQCIHRTKDYLEFIAKKIAEDNNQPWESFYEKALEDAISILSDKWDEKENGKPKQKAEYQWKQWIGWDNKKNEPRPDYAKKNVEFTNFRFFVEGVRDIFDKAFGGKTRHSSPTGTAIDVCRKIQDYRNDGSHSVYSLVYEEGEKSLCEAINKMKTLVEKLDNTELGGELENIKKKICSLYKGKPSDPTINNH